MKACPFSASFQFIKDDDQPPSWQFFMSDPVHNHKLSGGLGLPQFRNCIDDRFIDIIEDAVRFNTAPTAVYSKLVQLKYHITLKDVNNQMAKCRLEELGGRSKIEALYDILQTDFKDLPPDPLFPHAENDDSIKYFACHQEDDQGRLHALFWAHPYSIARLKEHPDVIMLDCTYKTNKFNMPFLHIVGITSMNTTYDIAYCLLPNEEEVSYNFAITGLRLLLETEAERSPRIFITDHEIALKNSLKAHFPEVPQRACLWHLMNNLEVKVHEIWGSNRAAPGQEDEFKELKDEFLARFQLIVDAQDQGVFELLYRKLKEDYAQLPALLAYIEDSMMPWQHEWAEYICRYMPSFGQRTTSRLEGSHCHMKKALINRSGEPYDLVKDLHFLIQRDRNEQKAKVDKAELRISTSHNQLMLSKLHTKVTPYALDLL
jgi:hypothetical protein